MILKIFVGALIAFLTLVFVVIVSACMNENHTVSVRQYDLLRSGVTFAMIVILVLLEIKVL